MEIDSNVTGENVEKLVRELMEGEKGKHMKSKAMEWEKNSRRDHFSKWFATMNLDRLILNEVLLS
jgi:hypothetical protein